MGSDQQREFSEDNIGVLLVRAGSWGATSKGNKRPSETMNSTTLGSKSTSMHCISGSNSAETQNSLPPSFMYFLAAMQKLDHMSQSSDPDPGLLHQKGDLSRRSMSDPDPDPLYQKPHQPHKRTQCSLFQNKQCHQPHMGRRRW